VTGDHRAEISELDAANALQLDGMAFDDDAVALRELLFSAGNCFQKGGLTR
jgi:hypothetical protein